MMANAIDRRPGAEEFLPDATEPPDAVSRREFLALAGASAALAGAGGCVSRPRERIVPYARTPETGMPGKPVYYATAMTLGGFATGLLVESHTGRPTKVEGNENHPASLGATDAFAQAAILTLYDPERSQTVMQGDRASSRAEAVAALRAAVAAARGKPDQPVRILTEAVTSPTFAQEMALLGKDFPEIRWHQYEPVSRGNARAGTRRAFAGDLDLDAVYRLQDADVILSLDADFLASGPGHLRYAREFADRRRVWPQEPAKAAMNRLYAVGPTPTPTTASADHFLPLRASDVGAFVHAVAARLGVPGLPPAPKISGQFPDDWLAGLADDIGKHKGRSLVVAGESQPPHVHALTHAINDHLKNAGATVAYVPPVHARPIDEMASLRELAADMRAGRVAVLVLLGANPAYSAPINLDFTRDVANVPFRFHLGLYRDETARLCHWHVPESHFLESWGDARAFDGTASVIQPLIAPLYDGVSALELVAGLRGQERAGYDLVREYWLGQWKDRPDAESRWDTALATGVIAGTAFEPQKVEPRMDWAAAGASEAPAGLEVVFRPDPTLHDGRFAPNAWLQELPKPLTKLTWDTVAMVGSATARELGLTHEIGDRGGDVSVDVVELHLRGRSVEAPVWVQPGHAEGTVTVYLGAGRTAAGSGSGVGFNANAIRTSDRPWFDAGLEVRKTERRARLATTQLHHRMHEKEPVRGGTLSDYQTERRTFSRRELPLAEHAPPSLYPEHRYTGHKWGMVIDLTACTGCGVCVVACQAENNTPVVGKEQVARGREMHWLRVDTYFTGPDRDRPSATFAQPVPCMQCENAPCEYVCPVNATVHSDDGLNDMVYNRCVGTRYCPNNCPYKVRRFNFLSYADWDSNVLKLGRNPEVTVRSRGVMEKCTYCVQRIRAAEIHAELEDRPPVRNREGELVRPIQPGELLTACQAACPSAAIAFGDLNDADSPVTKMRAAPLNYGLLDEELGTRPRTTYLAAVRNLNPAITTH
jgi:molybdopterin-containing oxidoreductase family iron-sulfur binding subunit